MTALFIPLKTEHFEAFKSGSKECEYRPYGPRWNERTCPVGREVVLSKGYGKRERLRGRVAWFNRQSPWYPPGWLAIYGPDPVEVAEIRITLTSSEGQP
jgi:hypothetical protein